MTDSNDPIRDDLELIEEAPASSPQTPQAPQVDYLALIFSRLTGGMSCPMFNPRSDPMYFRIFFGGLLMFIGTLIPFDADWAHRGYLTFSGSIWMIIALGVMWSMWGAVSSGALRMKWVLFAFFPFVWGLWHLFMTTPDFGSVDIKSWGDVFGLLSSQDNFPKFGNALQSFGPGKLLVFFGSLIVEFQFIMGLFGGIKKSKEIKANRTVKRRR